MLASFLADRARVGFLIALHHRVQHLQMGRHLRDVHVVEASDRQRRIGLTGSCRAFVQRLWQLSQNPCAKSCEDRFLHRYIPHVQDENFCTLARASVTGWIVSESTSV